MTPFEQAVAQKQSGLIQTPVVYYEKGTIDYFNYQLAVHKYNLGIMKMGMQVRGMRLKDLKQYYGLKGRTAEQCLAEFTELMDRFLGR